jgi:hypothetical protein
VGGIRQQRHRIRRQPEHHLGRNEADVQRGADGEGGVVPAGIMSTGTMVMMMRVTVMVVSHANSILPGSGMIGQPARRW